MSSILFWFWSFLFLGAYFENEVQGRRLQMIDGSMKNGSISYEATAREGTKERALDSKTSGHDEEKEGSKIHNRNHELARNKTTLDHLDVATDKESMWAILGTFRGTYYSAQATMSVHDLSLQVARNQESRASIWVINRGDGSPSSKNIIQAGWHVYPDLYGDDDTHFFVHWAAEGGARGCFNLNCEGFALSKSSDYTPGALIRPLSTYNGTQLFIDLKISKDQQTGDWWLHHGRNHDLPVGFWPKSLFTGLRDSATHVQYGGVVRYFMNDVSPPMGSGHFAAEGLMKAASLSNIELNGVAYDPSDENFFFDETEDACYTIALFKSFKMTGRLHFGGPSDCPA